MTLGELRAALDAALDAAQRDGTTEEDALQLEVVVRAQAENDEYCGTVQSVDVQVSRDDDETVYVAIDCVSEDELRAEEE